MPSLRDVALKSSGGSPAWSAILPRNSHITGMTTYTIIPASDGSEFHIGVAGSDGTRQTMLGFSSVAEAEAWIVQDKRLNDGAEASQEQKSMA
jgi:hypothetical protein